MALSKSLKELISRETTSYTTRKSEIQSQRAALNAEEAHIDANMTKLVDFLIAHHVPGGVQEELEYGTAPLQPE